MRRLDALILTHPDLDHIGRAAELVESIRVGSIAGPGFPRGTGPYLGVLRAAEARGASWVALRAGDAWDWDGLQLEVFHPGPDGSLAEPNDNSVVLRIRYGLFVALLTGDAPAAVEDALAARIGAVDLLKVAHHGSRTSSATLALESWQPALAVVSAGRGNRFGHPHEDVLGRLQDHADQILRTDLDGTVTVRGRADGAWTVRTARKRR